MKLREEQVNIERGGDIVESMFGISGKDSAHILNILRSKLYSNKILAVVREYCANAQDAHAEIGKGDMPIQIYLPNRLSPTFRVRDHGPGLSEDDIRSIYVMYGASTKRATNKAIGQLGLGCKSAFAYTEKFHVISRNNGEKKTYCAYIDETKCGKIALLTTEETEEQNGIEIQVPVRSEDFQSFENEALELLQYFQPVPNIANTEVPTLKYWLEGTTKSGIRFCCKGDKDGGTNYSSYVIMGGIPYSIPSNKLNLGDWQSKARQFIALGVDIYVSIGDLEVTANREDLEYTDHTANTLTKYVCEAADEALKLGTKEIANSPTYREANTKYHQMTSNRQFWRHANTVVQWKNKPLDGMMLPSGSNLYEILHPTTYTKQIRWNTELNISSACTSRLFDIDDVRSWRKKLIEYAAYIKVPLHQVRAIKWSGDDDTERTAARAKVYTERALKEYEIEKISQCKVPASALSAIQNTLASVRSTSHLGTIFSLKSLNDRKTYHRCKSRSWTRISKIPSGKKYYIEIDKFLPRINQVSGCQIPTLDILILTAKLAGVEINPENIYGIKKKQVAKITGDTEWVAFDTAVKGIVVQSKVPLEVADTMEFKEQSTTSTTMYACKKDLFPAKSVAFKLLNEIDRLQKIHTRINPELHRVKACMQRLDIQIPKPSVELEPLLKATAERYPLASVSGTFPHNDHSSSYGYYKQQEDQTIKKILPHVVEYVEFIEDSKEKVA